MYAITLRDLPYHPLFWMIIVLSLILFQWLGLSAAFVLGIYSFAMILSPFIFDRQNKSILTVVSLPISRSDIVKSRYLFGLVMIFGISLLQILADFILSGFNPNEMHYSFSGYLFFAGLVLILTALITLTFYIFKNLYWAFIVSGIILIIVFSGLFNFSLTTDTMYNVNEIDKILFSKAQSTISRITLVTGLVGLASYYLSYHLAQMVFLKKDL